MTTKVTHPCSEEQSVLVTQHPVAPTNLAPPPSTAFLFRPRRTFLTLLVGVVATLLAGVICLENAALAQQKQVSAPSLVEMPFSEDEQLEFFRKKSSLSEDEARELQAKVDGDPLEVAARFKLLAYYSGRRPKDAGARSSIRKLIRWFIRNLPEHAALTTLVVDASRDPEGFLEMKKQWIEIIEQNPSNAKIICNAVIFSLLPDPEWGDALLNKADQLEIKDPNSARRMGMVYGIRLTAEDSKKQREGFAQKAIEYYELAINLTKDPTEVSQLRIHAAAVAMNVGLLQSAETHAQQLLEDQGSDDSVHQAHILLGRLALQSGDRDKAKTHLLAAGKISSTPQLLRTGPNMSLARALLTEKETEVVLEYFKMCEKLCEKPELKQWTEQVKKGRIPDFGMHLEPKTALRW